MTWWEIVGRVAAFVVASVAALGVSSIVELYRPDVYEHIVESALLGALFWLIFLRRRR